MRKFIILTALLLSGAAHALSLDQLTSSDATAGLKEALTQGAGKAVDMLGKENGFLGNPKVRIPLPDKLNKAGKMMRSVGLGRQVDELETTLNRAAEAAVPEAKKLLVDAIRNMSVQDVKGILTGGNNSATEYFRRTTSGPLGDRFRPIVQQAIARVKLAEQYDKFAGSAARFGLISKEDSTLDGYVTNKALDGLFMMMAEEEKAIRENPLSAAGSLAQKVFGVLRN
ncbi:MAG: DUF4197 domain-containing protein [Azoarcus sp.]|jgi:hypothetical protein|nr:DUF4197 domain-containing protein [Azoarcus sp.]